MPATSAPTIPGFTFIEPIGEGGLADVSLYEQRLPSRRVAVKVLNHHLRGFSDVEFEQLKALLRRMLANAG